MQICMGFLNVGFVVDYIGFTVLNGFTTAAAVTILTSQVKYIFGLHDVRSGFLKTVYDVFSKLPEARGWDVLIGLGAMLLIWLGEKLKNKCVLLFWLFIFLPSHPEE
jgi:solute carrier family 26 (sodium-independent sulfate anion transporter), member 11